MTLQLPVPLFVDIAPGGDPAGNGDTWVWREVTEDVRNRRGVTIFQGRGDEATQVDAGTIDLELNNGVSRVPATVGQIGVYSPRNPTGPYYGSLNQNMPLRVGTYAGRDTFTRTEASGLGVSDSGHTWTVSGTASTWTVTGSVGTKSMTSANLQAFALIDDGGGVDVDATVVVALPATATGAALYAGLMFRYTSTADRYALRAEFAAGAGSITAAITRDLTGSGSTTLASAAVASSAYTAGQRWKIRGQADGQNLRLKIWKEADPEPDAWTVTAQDDSHQTSAVVGLYFVRLTGNTNSVQPQFHFDDFTVKAVEATGNVVELPVRWDLSGNDSWAPVTATGVLRRLQQGDDPLNSPLYNYLISQTTTGYWPMEDGSNATSISAAGPRLAKAGKVTGSVTFAAEETLPGSITCIKLNNGASRANFRIGGLTGGTGFSAMVFFRVDGTVPVTDTEILKLTTLGPIYTWRIRINGGSLIVNGYDATETLVINETGVTGLDFSAGWTAIQLETEVTGGSTTWTMLYNFVGTDTFFFFGDTYATTTAMRVVTAQLTGNGTSPMAYAHMWLGPNTLVFVDDETAAVAAGFAGETDVERIARIALDAGIPVLIEPGEGKPLGRQPRGGPLQVIRDAEAAGMGVLYERGPSLAYRPLSARYDPAVTLDLDIAQGHIGSPPPDPTDDDRYMANDVTVTRPDGGSARATDDDHIAAHARYPKPVELGVQLDDDLPDYAGWLLRLGTHDDLRWPRLPLNLRRNDDLIPAWRARRHGFRVTVAGEPDQILGSPPDVIAEGVAQTIRVDEWTVELSTSPARPYVIPAIGDDWIFDFESTTTAEALDTTETGVDITTPADEPPATAELVGAVIDIGGETMTVTAVSGSGSSQTLTVTRSTNDVVKSHASGALVRLKHPTYIAL